MKNINKMNKTELTAKLAALLGEEVAGKWTKAELITGIETETADQAKPVTPNQKHVNAINKQRVAIISSMALDRTLVCVEDGLEYGNVNQAFESGEYGKITFSQWDDLSNKLYSAAKRGEKIQVTKAGYTFELVNVA